MIVRNCVNPVASADLLRCGSSRSEVPSSRGFGGRCNVSTISRTRFRRQSRRRPASTREDDLQRGSFQPRYRPLVRALRSSESKQQEPRSPDDFLPIGSLPRAPISDLDDEELEDFPSLYKGRRRGSSLSRGKDVVTGTGGYFPRNNNRISSESPPPAVRQGSNKFVLGGLFILGMGAGIALDTVVNIEPSNVASREVIDRQTPNPDVCIANGMSAMVLDQRLFITFNPFNVYVSQAEVKPGCVLQQSNWRVLESRGLVNSEEVRDCKRNLNTFGFVGDLRQAPEINCVYHSENAENQFLKDPSKAALGDGFQPKDFSEP